MKQFFRLIFISIFVFLFLFSCKKTTGDVNKSLTLDKDAKYINGIKDDDLPLVISDYGPKEVMPIEMIDSEIWVLFSKPMIALERLGEEITDSVFTVDPPLRGVFRWYGTRMLSFIPKEPLLPATKYKIIIKDTCKSLSGASFSDPNKELSFYTETLSVFNIFPKGDNVPLSESNNIVLTFNMPIDPAEVAKSIYVWFGNEEKTNSKKLNFTYEVPSKVKFKNYDEAALKKMMVVKISDSIPANTKVNVCLEKDAKPTTNSIGSEKDVTFSYETLKPFELQDFYNSSYCYGYEDPHYATFEFSQPVDPTDIEKFVSISLYNVDLKKYISVDPAPLYSYEDSYYSFYGSYGRCVRLSKLPVEYNSSYVITIKKGLKDIYGQELQETIVKEIDVGDAEQLVHFPDNGNKILESDYGSKYAIATQNVFKGKFKIQKGTDPFSDKLTVKDLLPFTQLSSLPINKYCTTEFDLKPYLNANGKGIINMAWDIGPNEGERWNIERLNLQVTNLGISVRFCSNKFLVMVGELNSGKPVVGATVNIKNNNSIVASGVSDENGLASIPFTQNFYKTFYDYKDYQDRVVLVEAIKDDDQVCMKVSNYSETHNIWKFGIYGAEEPQEIDKPKDAIFMFTDRGLYRPGEIITFKGVDRKICKGEFFVYSGKSNLSISNGNDSSKIFDKTITLSDVGTFSESVQLPDSIKPGYYSIAYKRIGSSYPCAWTSFRVAEFRRVAFAVKSTIPDVIWYQGDKVLANVKAHYLSGGDLKSFNVNYYWAKNGVNFYPKDEKYKSFQFGPRDYAYGGSLSSGTEKGSGGNWSSSQLATGFSDGQPYSYNLEVSVADIDRQVIGSSVSTVVHPAAYYIGAKISGQENYYTSFVEKNKEFAVDLVTISPDSMLWSESEKVTCKLVREEWVAVKQQGIGGHVQLSHEKKDVVEKEFVTTITKGVGSVKFKTEKSGSYKIIFTAKDSKKRNVLTQLDLYSTGSDWVMWGNSGSNEISLVADKKSYSVGDKAKLLIKSPLKSGKYLLTIERENIIDQKILDLEGSANLIPIDIDKSYVPHVFVALTSYSARTAEPPTSEDEVDIGKPKGYFGIAEINVDTKTKVINLDVTKDKISYLPGEKVSLKIKATYQGAPVPNAEITYLAADRGVLDLINYHIADPVDFFYNTSFFPLAVLGGDSRDNLMSPITYDFDNLPGGDGETKSKIRKDFRPTAVFLPSLITDANGEVTADFILPDSLTTYRDTAFAVTKENFGIKEEEILVSNPINVRTSLPRKLRINDKAKAGVVVTNLSGADQDVTITCNSDLITVEKNIKTVKVANGESLEVPFDLYANCKSGESQLEFVIKNAIFNETLQDKLVIEQPIITESVTLTGKTDKTHTEGFKIPKDVNPKEGGFAFNLDSTRFAMLGRAFSYLKDYPYDCLEQRVSRIFPLISFGEQASKSFGFTCPENVSFKSQISKFLNELGAYQKENGGFVYWPNSYGNPSYYLSVRVYHLLVDAKNSGVSIPKSIDMNLLRAFIKTEYVNNKYLNEFDKAYSCYVLSLDHEDVKTKLSVLEMSLDKLSLSTSAFIALSYVNCGDVISGRKIFTNISNYIRVGTQTVDVTQPNTASSNYFWNEETDLALILMCYNIFKPDTMLLENIVRTLFQRSSQGYWHNTHTTGWILYSFAEVFKTEAGKDTNFDATVSLGNTDIISQTFKGINTNTYRFELGMEQLQQIQNEGLLPLTFDKKGNGTLYFTATLKYALPMQNITARDEGLGVFGQIYDTNEEIYKLENGLPLGKNYRYKVYITSNRDREFVAVRIPLPSGAEPIDGSFATSITVHSSKEETASVETYNYSWFSPRPVQTIYDNEVQYFIDRLQKGKTVLEFQFRTTSPGVYQTPPITAECMYEPEVFGRSNGVAVEIK